MTPDEDPPNHDENASQQRGRYLTSEKGLRHQEWDPKVGNWNISSLRRKQRELVDDAIEYQLDIVGLSSMKRPGAGLLNLSHLSGGKLFFSRVAITTCAQAGVGVLVEPNLADRIIDWKPISGTVVILRLKLQQAKSTTLVQRK
ncbi:unnamed protein product [Soboliphyme baturini]|uniref:Oxidored_FMN domain-containing protein n=1 Tax=Soboliphyme baturini TaxID=241478 RepID=A0A183J223_9BILA|nr:unnamed protein product [Soboliphyme baturini]